MTDKIIWLSHKGPVKIKQWIDDTVTPHTTNISGECSMCHQFPCIHVMQDAEGNWKFKAQSRKEAEE
jgi:hypothetical protein